MINFISILIRLYRLAISPYLPSACKYTPTCSHYFETAIKTHGILKGLVLFSNRIIRCNPFTSIKYDPVPNKNTITYKTPIALTTTLVVTLLLLTACSADSILPPASGWGPPAITNNSLFILTAEGEVRSYDTKNTGQLLWSFPDKNKESKDSYREKLLGGAYSSPVIEGTTLFVTGYNGKVYALNTETGEEIWDKTFTEDTHFISGPLIANNQLVLITTEGIVYSLNLENGKFNRDQSKMQPLNLQTEIWATPSHKNGTFFIGTTDHQVFAISSTGKILWQRKVNGAIVGKPLIVSHSTGNLIIVGDLDNTISAFDNNGNVQWQKQTEDWLWAGLITADNTGNHIIASDIGGNIYKIKTIDGSIITTTKLDSRIISTPILMEDLIVIGGNSGRLYFLANDSLNEVESPYSVGEPIRSPLVTENNIVYFTTNGKEKYILAFDVKNSKKLWKVSTKRED